MHMYVHVYAHNYYNALIGFIQYCIAVISCEVLTLPDNAQFIFNEGNMYNQTIIVGCLPGYIPANATSLTCGIDGSWDADLPICVEGI